jgi:eukaryotic-like serine/threonine-protein kinase
MTSEQWQRVRQVFENALDVEPAELDRWLLEQPLDAGLRAEVASLLANHSHAGSFLVAPLAEQVPALLDEEEALKPGTVVGHYKIAREIGRGAMGRVYLAEDVHLGRSVALKALAPHLSGDPAHRERLRREARAAAGLMHPGICAVYALEEFDGQLFIVSELIDGHTLREEIAGSARPDAESIAATARDLAEALACAHARGITHRDFKPENVMRDRTGRLKVLDFGLAHVAEPRVLATPGPIAPMTATLAGAFVGTPAYMAPEQLNGQRADARADVFAYGVVVYEYACGAHPFEAPTPIGLVARVLEGDARSIADRTRHVPASVAAIVDRCLCKAPGDRFPSATEIVASLKAADTASPRPAAGRTATWWVGHQLIVMAVYVAAAAIAWSIKEAFPGSLVLSAFIALGICSAVAGILRAHLLFTAAVNPPHLKTERLRVQATVVVIDLLIAGNLVVDGVQIATARPLWSVLTIGLAAGIALATTLMEPATAAAAWPE